MDTLNRAMTKLFDLALRPLEAVGERFALIAVAAVFGVLALLVFKRISPQRRIKATKDRIKGHLIEIRLYQDDFRLVTRAIGKTLARNAQYLALNLGPFVPLAIPFLLVVAQLVVRYGYAPLPVVARADALLPGEGVLLEVALAPEARGRVRELALELPGGLRALSPLVRVPAEGRAFVELAAVAPGEHELALVLGGERETLALAAGAPARRMQPVRVAASGWWRVHEPDACPLYWPAQRSFAAGSSFARASFAYPDREHRALPDGPGGVVLTFVLASMLAGLVAVKPLGVEI
jgi:hypothetical protein